MISSKVLILKVIIVILLMGGCAPEDGGNKSKSVNLYLKNNSDPSSIFCAMDFFNKI